MICLALFLLVAGFLVPQMNCREKGMFHSIYDTHKYHVFSTDLDLGDYKKCYKEGGRCRGLTFYSPQSLLQHHHL